MSIAPRKYLKMCYKSRNNCTYFNYDKNNGNDKGKRQMVIDSGSHNGSNNGNNNDRNEGRNRPKQYDKF